MMNLVRFEVKYVEICGFRIKVIVNRIAEREVKDFINIPNAFFIPFDDFIGKTVMLFECVIKFPAYLLKQVTDIPPLCFGAIL